MARQALVVVTATEEDLRQAGFIIVRPLCNGVTTTLRISRQTITLTLEIEVQHTEVIYWAAYLVIKEKKVSVVSTVKQVYSGLRVMRPVELASPSNRSLKNNFRWPRR